MRICAAILRARSFRIATAHDGSFPFASLSLAIRLPRPPQIKRTAEYGAVCTKNRESRGIGNKSEEL
jgi:hypothetical protein